MTERAEQSIAAARAEIVDGATAQRAARAVVASWVAEAARHRTRDLVRSSLTAGAAHDVGGTRRKLRADLPVQALAAARAVIARARAGERSAPTIVCDRGCCLDPIGVTTSCEANW